MDLKKVFDLPSSIKNTLDSVPVSSMVLNKNYEVIYTSLHLRNYFHHKNGVAEGFTPGDLFRCAHIAKGRKPHTGACKSCGLVSATKKTVEESLIEANEITVFDSNCVFRDFKVTSAPLVLGENSFVILTMQDISDQKRRRVLERIFFHDIMNIVGVLNSYSEIINQVDDQDKAEIIKRILPLTLKLVDEINAQKQLLEAESGELKLTLAPYDINLNLGSLISFFSDHPLSKDKEIVLHLEKESPKIITDKALFDRVIINLIKNALEASTKGDKISLGYKLHADRVDVWVHNPSVISKEVREHLFMKSISTKGVGRGIGTYSIKLLTEKYLRGDVDFISNEEDKTKFTVTLPLKIE